ncbi:MAG: RidA family protein [Planctomycetes bacterium]|nr:RidA family protein [Planctomycetota bacterium]
MKPEPVQTSAAPAAIGPYSQAVRAGNLLFCSGQIPLDPKTMQIVGKTAAEQAEQVLQNLAAVLRAAGASLADVVNTTLYLVAIDDFAAVNEVYASHFGAHKPARATVAVKELPRHVLVEIDCIAALS